MAHDCPLCRRSRRPVGKVIQEPDGWAVYRWNQPSPVVSGLSTRGEGMKVLWALKHRWGSITVKFRRQEEPVKLDLTSVFYL